MERAASAITPTIVEGPLGPTNLSISLDSISLIVPEQSQFDCLEQIDQEIHKELIKKQGLENDIKVHQQGIGIEIHTLEKGRRRLRESIQQSKRIVAAESCVRRQEHRKRKECRRLVKVCVQAIATADLRLKLVEESILKDIAKVTQRVEALQQERDDFIACYPYALKSPRSPREKLERRGSASGFVSLLRASSSKAPTPRMTRSLAASPMRSKSMATLPI